MVVVGVTSIPIKTIASTNERKQGWKLGHRNFLINIWMKVDGRKEEKTERGKEEGKEEKKAFWQTGRKLMDSLSGQI